MSFQEVTLQLLSPTGLLLVVLGTALGIFAGAIPGLTGAMLIALALPFTYGCEPAYVFAFLTSIYVGAISGGLISSTLLKIPGTPDAAVTTLDGYPLAKSGKPDRALMLGVMSSFFGGLFSTIVLLIIAPPLAGFATSLGAFDLFALTITALAIAVTSGGKSLSKGLLAITLGILAAVPGISPATGEPRFTAELAELENGLPIIPLFIGIFAVARILSEAASKSETPHLIPLDKRGLLPRIADLKKHFLNLVRSSLLGTWIGFLPGVGAEVGSNSAYSAAKKASRSPDKFGTGHEPGIIAAESANSATVGGALLPWMSLGIPGSIVEAALFGALIFHGLAPGPLLFTEGNGTGQAVIGALFLANGIMVVIMLSSMRFLAKLSTVPRSLLLPVVLIVCIVGCYTLGNRMLDVWVMLIFAAIGVLFTKCRIPLVPFILAFLLWPEAESNLTESIRSSEGKWGSLILQPFPLVCLALSFFLLVIAPVRSRLRRRRELATS